MPDAPLGPSFDLQAKVVEIWKVDSTLTALMGSSTWLYQDVQRNAAFPYVSCGQGQDLPDLADCIEGREVFLDFDIWSQKGFKQCKQIGTALVAALPADPPALTENTCLVLEFNGARYFRDPDGKTIHGVLTLRALIEPA
jgi:hypothetical protein